MVTTQEVSRHMVGMLDYHLHYGLMATEDRVRDTIRGRRSAQPIRPHRLQRVLRSRSALRGR